MASYKDAVFAKCKDCIYDPKSGFGHWREQVTRCTVYLCPLWEIRPKASSGPMAEAPTTPESHLEWIRGIEANEKHITEA